MKLAEQLRNKGLGIATAHTFETETSSMIHEQLARLKFTESKIDFRGKGVLDFGCGTGYNSYYLAKHDSPARVVGIDLLEDCIAYCKSRYSADRTEYHVQDCLAHSPRLGTFDVAISFEVLEHVAEQDSFLSSMAKYLAPSGSAVISTPNKGLLSLSKDRSFLNNTHVKELFFDEFEALLTRHFSDFKIYSQVHTQRWRGPYVNYLCATNLVHALETEVFRDPTLGRLASRALGRLLYPLLFRTKFAGYLDVRDRRHYDFEFHEGFSNHAMWFVAICKNPV